MTNIAIDKVQALEDWIKTKPQGEYPCRHYFAGGVYEREITVPAGHVITGKIHLTEHLAKLVKGTMTIYSNEGSGTITGPITFVSTPGSKRAGYAHDEVTFSTFHYVGDKTDLNLIESDLVVETYEQYELGLERSLEVKS